MSNPSEWLHFHPNSNTSNPRPSFGHVASSYGATSPSEGFFSGLVSEATAVSTVVAPGPAQLGPEGRVSKPARQRARASRRTPTTLINTDTVNFRATVQQFTGGPSSNFSPLSQQGYGIQPGTGPGLGYGLPYRNSNTSNNNNNDINASMFMHTNYMGENNNYNAYVANSRINNNDNADGGSSSSEYRSNNNFQY
ncbi:hypothetical protein vseg_004950 [Gypsophila vaccaria]